MDTGMQAWWNGSVQFLVAANRGIDPRGRWGSAGRVTTKNRPPARGDAKGGVPASDADGTTRTTKRGKIVGNRLQIRVCVGYNHKTLKRFMPSICPPGQGSGGRMGGRIGSYDSTADTGFDWKRGAGRGVSAVWDNDVGTKCVGWCLPSRSPQHSAMTIISWSQVKPCFRSDSHHTG